MADDRTRGPSGHADGGEGASEGERTRRRRANETISWLVVGLMMVVGGGAVGYMYMQHRVAPTSARVHAARGSKKTAHSEHGATPARGRGAHSKTASPTTGEPKATSYYPALGTPTRPVDGNVVERFGWQYQKAIGLYRDVPGWALEATQGEPVRAVIGGRVVANWVDPTEGREVVVNSKNGDSIIYGDLASPGPSVGTEIKAGEVFAHVGTSGKLSGVSTPHLFLEVTVDGQPVSPSVLLGDVPGSTVTTAAPAKVGVTAKA